MKPSLPVLQSLNAGYVDTAGFLALHGLFTAHVTGNFVTFGASMVLGTSGAVAKLMALPVFCLIIVGTRIFTYRLQTRGVNVLRTTLGLKVLLLTLGGYLAVRLGPFPDGDGLPALATGMALVAAMAIQNAIHRIHLGSSPPTTLMTGTTTQMMIDVADLFHGVSPEAASIARGRLARMSANVITFAFGCGLGALLYAKAGVWCFALPPLFAVVEMFLPLPTSVAPVVGAASKPS